MPLALTAGLSDAELTTLATYQASAADWSGQRSADPGFWAPELDRVSRLTPHGRVLDVGSGNGRDARLLSARGYRVTGVDISPALLELARAACPAAEFQLGSVYELPFADASFDLVWAAAIILHLPKRSAPAALAELRRVLRPGGAAFVAVKRGDGEHMISSELGDRFFALYQPEELAGALTAAGLTVTWTGTRVAYDVPWLSAIAINPPA